MYVRSGIKMLETNPLQTCPTTSQKSRFYNKSGRPTNAKAIKFTPQPQSIISQLLKKIKEDADVEHCQQLDVLETTNEEIQQDYDDILCQKCSHRSSNMKQHREHMKTHKVKLFACDYLSCDYTCKLSSNMIKHKRTHTSERPFLCDQCTFRSNFINSLKVHKRIHTDERPYSCSHCSYRCNSSSNLKKHCRHRHSSEVAYS